MQFQYTWLHIPTGKTGEGSGEFGSEDNFLRHLNEWNRFGMGKWLYHSSQALRQAAPAAIYRFPPKELIHG